VKTEIFYSKHYVIVKTDIIKFSLGGAKKKGENLPADIILQNKILLTVLESTNHIT
jgi:hypothetical protein